MLSRAAIGAMTSAANTAIAEALLHGAHQMRVPPRAEVGFVAAVILRAIPEIATAWVPICLREALSLSLTGVFCHGAPTVQFATTGGRSICELADLLVVVDVHQTNGYVRRAALIQAKMARAACRVSLSGSSSRVQLDLYQNWPIFDFVKPVYGLNNVDFKKGAGERDIQGHSASLTAT